MTTASQNPPDVELVISYRDIAGTENIWEDNSER